MTPRQAMLARLGQAARRRLQWPMKPVVTSQRAPRVRISVIPGPYTHPNPGRIGRNGPLWASTEGSTMTKHIKPRPKAPAPKAVPMKAQPQRGPFKSPRKVEAPGKPKANL